MNQVLRIGLFFCCIGLFFTPASGQQKSSNRKAQQYYEKGLQSLQFHDYKAAITLLRKAVSEDPAFATAYQQLGDIHRKQQHFRQAVPCYEEVMHLNPTLTTLTLFGLGESLLHTGRYTEALPYLKRYREGNITEKTKNLVDKYIADCHFALRMDQVMPISRRKLPPSINTSNDEYFPKLTADNSTIIFTRKENNQENFYESRLTGSNDWTEAKKLVGEINSANFNEGAHCISPDGKYLFFTGCNRPNGQGSCDIYVAKKENGRWSTPMLLSAPINTKGWEAQPAISADGRTLYFVSNRAGGMGGNDIWKSELDRNGQWKEPVNLGKNINTPYDESAPYIHADNKTLYFASNGWPGYGGQDLYMSKVDTSGNWTMPVNLGKPINDSYNQTAIHVSMNGAMGYFSSQDTATYRLDIHEFTLPDFIKPNPVAYIAGTVRDANNKQPLAAKISVTNTASQDIVFEDQSDEQDGKFIATLPIGQNYAVHVQREGYLFDSRQYDLTDTNLANEKFITEILLSTIEPGNTTKLGNVYFDTNKYNLLSPSKSDLQLLLKFLKINPTTKIEVGGHTDNTGNKELNDKLSENRANAVKQYLLQNGIAASRIMSKGYGDRLPVASNDTNEGRQLNRRTEIKVIR